MEIDVGVVMYVIVLVPLFSKRWVELFQNDCFDLGKNIFSSFVTEMKDKKKKVDDKSYEIWRSKVLRLIEPDFEYRII